VGVRPAQLLLGECREKRRDFCSLGSLAAPDVLAHTWYDLSHAPGDRLPIAVVAFVSTARLQPLFPVSIHRFTLLMAPLIAVPQIYLARALRPLLADAPRTDERIKLAEQLPRVAAAASTKLLVIGLVSAVAMMVAGGLLLLDAFLEGRLAGSALFSSSILAVMGGLLTFYFIFLLRLKAKAKPA
jgi:hypothetical protein